MKITFKFLILLAVVLATVFITVACNSGADNCEHSYIEVDRQEYCTREGILYLHCAKCGHSTQEKLDPIGHDEFTIEAVDATCATNGSTEGKACNRCGEYTVAPKEIPAGHQIEIIPARAATCTENGLSEGKFCPICNTVIDVQQIIPAEHAFEFTLAIEPTCTEDGRSEGVICTRCDLVQKKSHVIPAGHIVEFVASLAETCTTDGHNAGYICTRCNLVLSGLEIIPAGHKSVITPGKEGYPATCTSTGMSPEMLCSECHATTSIYAETPMADHSYEIIPGYAATCTSEGLTDGYRCKVCGYIEAEQQVIETIDHVAITVKGYPATCTAAGLSDGEKCQHCGQIIKGQYSISPTSHSFGEDCVCVKCNITITAELVYEVLGNSQCIVSGLTDGAVPSVIVIPDLYNDIPVVAIKDGAFKDVISIEKVIISKRIQAIGNSAFTGCTALKIIECADISQIIDLGSAWYENIGSDLRIVAALNNGKTPHEAYVEAMSMIKDNYTLKSTFNTYITQQGITSAILSTVKHGQVNGQDFLEWTEKMDYLSGSVLSELSIGYIDGYIYYIDDRYGLCKMAISNQDMIDLFGTKYINDTTVSTKPEDFKYSQFYIDISGELHISLDLSEERFREIALEMMPDSDIRNALLEDHVFEYKFDIDGKVVSYGFTVIKNGIFRIERITEISNVDSTETDSNHPLLQDAILLGTYYE